MKWSGFNIKTERESGTNAKDIKLRGDRAWKYGYRVKTVFVPVQQCMTDAAYFDSKVNALIMEGYDLVETQIITLRETLVFLYALLINRIVREDDVND